MDSIQLMNCGVEDVTNSQRDIQKYFVIVVGQTIEVAPRSINVMTVLGKGEYA